ncbi:MAG: class I SAM-dependent methyltransferase [Lachnospiraceae bacterium]|nr:class I SAM-dependent methyltransferase [Lachnospiraceae bacterium]
MESYTSFAKVYDMFMDNIDYESWGTYLIELLKEYGVKDGIVADLGCGTGNITTILSRAGYDMIGIDNSAEMLAIAMDKEKSGGQYNDELADVIADEEELNDNSAEEIADDSYDNSVDESEDKREVLYLLQDMREFELYGTVAAVVSICDSINYITDYDDLVTVFKLVNNYLDPGGVFIFDLSTKSKFEQIGESVIAEDREESSFIWDNYYYEDECINEYQLSIFIKGEDGRYDKFSETHYQRAYSLEEVKSALTEAGLEFVAAYEAFTHEDVKEENERIYVIAREVTK